MTLKLRDTSKHLESAIPSRSREVLAADELYSLRIGPIAAYILSERLVFILICTYLFFEYFRPQSIYPVLYPVPWTQITIIGALLTYIVDTNRPMVARNAATYLMIAYFLIVLLSSLFGYAPELSFDRLRKFGDWLIIYFLISHIIATRERFFIFFLSFLLYNLKMSQHAFISWAKRGFTYENWGVTGAPGWFHNSGELGIQMCIFVPLSIATIFALKPYIGRLYFAGLWILPVSGIGAVIASSSRGAIAGLFAVGVWSLAQTKYFFRASAGLLCILVIALWIMPDDFAKRFEDAGEDRNSLHRLERWEDGLAAMNQHPILGVGFDIWPEYYRATHSPDYPGTPLVHNVFVQTGSELGYSGLIVFLLLITSTFLMTKQIRVVSVERSDRFSSVLSRGFDGALIGYLVSASFVTVQYYPYFWINLAMVVALFSYVQIEKRAESGRHFAKRAGQAYR